MHVQINKFPDEKYAAALETKRRRRRGRNRPTLYGALMAAGRAAPRPNPWHGCRAWSNPRKIRYQLPR